MIKPRELNPLDAPCFVSNEAERDKNGNLTKSGEEYVRWLAAKREQEKK